jgi:rhodanese-related sulfurtransferase
LERDYKSGHIEDAISLPINCSDEMYTEMLSSLEKDKKIVLYCQSAGCQFAEKIALRLKEDGFENLAIFKGGWVEWQKAAEAQSAKSKDQKDEKNV